jgi:hypothetical protein
MLSSSFEDGGRTRTAAVAAVRAPVINGDRSAINRYHRRGFDPERAASTFAA